MSFAFLVKLLCAVMTTHQVRQGYDNLCMHVVLTFSIYFGLAAVFLQAHHRSAHEAHGGILGDLVAHDAPPLVIVLKKNRMIVVAIISNENL